MTFNFLCQISRGHVDLYFKWYWKADFYINKRYTTKVSCSSNIYRISISVLSFDNNLCLITETNFLCVLLVTLCDVICLVGNDMFIEVDGIYYFLWFYLYRQHSLWWLGWNVHDYLYYFWPCSHCLHLHISLVAFQYLLWFGITIHKHQIVSDCYMLWRYSLLWLS